MFKRLADIAPQGSVADTYADVKVTGITADSRLVEPGFVFVAIAGARGDGSAYAVQALERGACAIVSENLLCLTGAVIVQVADARKALSFMARRFYPRQPDTVVAVTGTSGKTSVAAFVRQIWELLGHNAASIGTVGVVAPWGEAYSSLTTPDPVELHRVMNELACKGVTHLALEASSHGLDQHRLDEVQLKAAAFTNLSRDHLDYHHTAEAYREAKLRLFRELLPAGAGAVIEADHSDAGFFINVARERGLDLWTVGENGQAIRLSQIQINGFEQHVTLEHRGRAYEVRLQLAGRFQVENAIVAAGLCLSAGESPDAVFSVLERLKGARGRLELVGTVAGAPVFVDYAHKPDALEKAIGALRPFVRGKLVVVFGCGGDRDTGKRPVMGEIAARLADRVIVTDDNPRSEDPALIRAAILAEARGAAEIGDRRLAIETAISELADGDVLLIAGKGHEAGQIIGDKVLPFSDHDVAQEAIHRRSAMI